MDSRVLESLKSGQCFRFKEDGGVYRGVIKDTFYTLSSSNISLLENDRTLYDYFDLGRDYESIKEYLSSLSPIMKEAIDEHPYIRILKQDREEVLLSFILSSCNNISRISLIIKRLSEKFGKPVEKFIGDEKCKNDRVYYTFPTVTELSVATEDDFRKLGLGFRSSFFFNAVHSVLDGTIDLDKIYNLDDTDARNYLMRLKGVGEKVADCILLFGYNRLSVFPKDVHIKRVMNTYFNGKDETFFAPYSGIAQQFLFYLDLYKKDML